MGSVSFSKPRALAEGDSVEGFSCGTEPIDRWVATRALGAKKAGTAVVYATFAERRLAGFYSLSAQSIVRCDTSGWISRNAPEHIPVILLGMLGVDERFQGLGLGHDLLLDAVRRAQSVADQIGARAIVVDPFDDAARAFYLHHGFRDLPGTTRMFAKLR